MKIKPTLVSALLVAGALLSPQTSNAIKVRTFDIMSYNIRNGNGMDNRYDLDRTASVINRVGAEVIALQEIDSMTGRSGRKEILAELAAKTKMHPTFARAIAYDGGAYGIGLLSHKKPINVTRFPLPGREEARALLIAEFDDYIFMATHLSLTAEDQSRSLVIIDSLAGVYSAASGGTKPIFVAGDMNFTPKDKQIKLLQQKFKLLSDSDIPTYPASKPETCIDYIWGYTGGSQQFKVTESSVVDAPTESDHRPVSVTLNAGDLMRTDPYLQNPTGGGITITWLTSAPAYSWLEWGSDSNNMQRARTMYDGQAQAGNQINKIRIKGLEAGMRYFYRVCSREMLYYGAYQKTFGAEAKSPIYTFTTPPKDGDFTAVVFNDLHQRGATMDTLMSVVRKHLGTTPFDFVIFNGDCIDDPYSLDQASSTIAYFNRRIGATQIPVFYMRGNHEIRGPFSVGLRDLYDYIDDHSYGAFSWGDSRFVMLDCGEDKPDSHPVYYDLNDFEGLRKDQAAFLVREMASPEYRKAAKRILVHHIPIYGERDEYSPCTELWAPIFASAKVRKTNFDVALNGHTHRFDSYTKGEASNPFPVVVGGGPALDQATVTILERRGEKLTLRVLNVKGEQILVLDL